MLKLRPTSRTLAVVLILIGCALAIPQFPSAFKMHVLREDDKDGRVTVQEDYWWSFDNDKYRQVMAGKLSSVLGKNATTITTGTYSTLDAEFFDRWVCYKFPYDGQIDGPMVPSLSVHKGQKTIDGIECDVYESLNLGYKEFWFFSVKDESPVMQELHFASKIERSRFTHFTAGAPPDEDFAVPARCRDYTDDDMRDVFVTFGKELASVNWRKSRDAQTMVNDPKRIARINEKASSWTAGHNLYFEGARMIDAQRLLGQINDPRLAAMNLKKVQPQMVDIPATFDSRQAWPECESIKEIRDQGSCGSCWAVSLAEVSTDRLCIARNGTVNPRLSPMTQIGCDKVDKGCNGGEIDLAWQWAQQHGLPTLSCLPYHGIDWFCKKKCDHGRRMETYAPSRIYSPGDTVEEIQREILSNGPVQGAFWVFDDFNSYKHGVYVRTSSLIMGGHAIKIIGWTEDAWIVANSWNSHWGENGTFRIRKGTNECGIEDLVATGVFN